MESVLGQPVERTTRSKLSDVAIIVILLVIALVLENKVIDVHQQFIPGLDNTIDLNSNFAYPNIKSTVSGAALPLVALIPWYIIMTISLITLYFADDRFEWRQCLKQIYLMHRMFLFCYCATFISCDCIKLFVGAPRPYYLAVHNADRSEEFEGRLSFVSGHAAGLSNCLLLSAMLFSSWQYTQNMCAHSIKLSIVGIKCDNPHSYYLCGLWWYLREIPLLCILLIGLPTYIGIWNGLTRIRDYKHSAADVVGGWFVGALIAFVSYLIYYRETYGVFDWKLQNMINKMRVSESKKGNPTDVNDQKESVINTSKG